MIKIDRKLFREQMKKEFKKFLKENKAYKNMTFSQFTKIVKLNMAKPTKPLAASVLDASGHDHDHTHDHADFDNMFASVEEGTNDASETAEQ